MEFDYLRLITMVCEEDPELYRYVLKELKNKKLTKKQVLEYIGVFIRLIFIHNIYKNKWIGWIVRGRR